MVKQIAMVWRLKRDGGEKKHNRRAVREKQLKSCFCGRGESFNTHVVLLQRTKSTTTMKINQYMKIKQQKNEHKNQATTAKNKTCKNDQTCLPLIFGVQGERR